MKWVLMALVSIDTLDKDTGKLKMNGREVFKFAVRIMGDASTRVVEKANLTSDDIDLFIPHQANIRIMESANRTLRYFKRQNECFCK